MEYIKALEEELKIEKNRLNELVHRALSGPIKKNDEIVAQRRIVDNLARKLHKEKNKIIEPYLRNL